MRADSQTALANNLYFTSLGAVTLDFMMPLVYSSANKMRIVKAFEFLKAISVRREKITRLV